MELRGRVKDGVVHFNDPAGLPDGTEVRVEPVKRSAKRKKTENLTLSQKLLRLAGKAKGLPPDFAYNHDHYIHGTPKKK